MKVVGLITEYNPFHNGHQYHIEQAKKQTGADRVIVVMSGDFVQRGQPAIMPKHLRAKIALECGASAVFELPVRYATGSAESFASGAITLLHNLGVVDAICFGSECGDIQIMQEIAQVLVEEPAEYISFLRQALQDGDSYPSARAHALGLYTGKQHYCDILNQPNNILGIEYLKALIQLSSPIIPFTIQRQGAGYHDEELSDSYSSASAIRQHLRELSKDAKPDPFLADINNHVPKNCIPLLKQEYQKSYPVYTNTFSLVLKYALLSEERFDQYQDVSTELSNRIQNERNHYQNFEQFCDLLKTKELTYTRISRALLHIMLRIKKCDSVHDKYDVFYGHLLGFRSDESDVLSKIKQYSSIPMLTKLSDVTLQNDDASKMFREDCFASNLYQSAVSEIHQTPFVNEYQKQIIRI